MAQTFFVDERVGAKTKLDSIITVVDAKWLRTGSRTRGGQDRSPSPTSSCSTRPTSSRHRAEARSRGADARFNPLAPIHRGGAANVALDAIISRGGFDLDRIVALEPEFLRTANRARA